jgi:hypothetical protein
VFENDAGIYTSLGKARRAFWQGREVGGTPASCERERENYTHAGCAKGKNGSQESLEIVFGMARREQGQLQELKRGGEHG